MALSDLSRRQRVGMAAGVVVAPVALALWTVTGPLAGGWAGRSGTPVALLGGGTVATARGAAGPAATSAAAAPSGTASLTGTEATRDLGNGLVAVILSADLRGGPGGHLRIELTGTPLDEGGVALASGVVTLTPASGGSWAGQVDGLSGGAISATLHHGSRRDPLRRRRPHRRRQPNRPRDGDPGMTSMATSPYGGDAGTGADHDRRWPRLLTHSAPAGLVEHRAWHGPLPRALAHEEGRRRLLDEIEASGLTGRGGAGFPVARKLRAVATRRGIRGSVVVGNGSEGEPASAKDKTLMAVSPHLVLDGLEVASRLVGARSVWLYVSDDPGVLHALRAALAERPPADQRVRLAVAAPRFLAGEESAVVSALTGGLGLPTTTPPRVFERGVHGRPTLVQNVETLANLALIARWGAEWFRSVGDEGQPGSRLFTVWDRDRSAVVEASTATSARELYRVIGVPMVAAQAVLLGGYHGTWLPAGEGLDVPLSDARLRAYGASAGAGVVAALPPGVCGVLETARVVTYLAQESARQCGPCLNGLPLIAEALRSLARPGRHPGVRSRIERWAGLVDGRGACRHPDGTVRLVRSALHVFADELADHERGRCRGVDPPFLPVSELR